jgi:hypothetical protein
VPVFSLDKVECYSLRTGKWRYLPRLTVKRSGLACLAFQVIAFFLTNGMGCLK